MSKKDIARKIYGVIVIIAILAVIIPIIIGAGYTYPCEDDFSFEMGGKIGAETYGNFWGAFDNAYTYYRDWQGTYFANFLWYFIRPYDRGGLSGFRVCMILLNVLLVFSLGFLVNAMVKNKRYVPMLLLAVYVIAFNTSPLGSEKEFLYWYTGAINYLLEFALAGVTLALVLLLRGKMTRRSCYLYTLVASITGFLASGGSLEVTAVHCSWLLLMLIMCHEEIPQRKMLVIPFVVSLTGALINACAPGNFARSDATSGEIAYTVADALRDTLVCWRRENHVIFSNHLFVILLLIIFIVCICAKIRVFSEKLSTVKLILLLPAVFLIQCATIFPVVFGYHGSELIYSRTTYTYYLVSKLMILFLIVFFAQWLMEHFTYSAKRISVIVLMAIAFFVVIRNDVPSDVRQGFSYNVTRELKNGTIQEMGKFRERILALIEQSERGTDVYLKVPNVPSSEVMYGMGLGGDPNWGCNSHAATYFELNSLSIDYSDEYEFSEE